MLSDPYQRGRYDERRADGRGETAASTTVTTTASSNGSGSRTPATRFRGLPAERRRARVDERAAGRARRAAEPDAHDRAPARHELPPTRNRIIAMVIDLIVLLVIFISVSSSAPTAPGEVAEAGTIVDAGEPLNDKITAKNKVKSDADKSA